MDGAQHPEGPGSRLGQNHAVLMLGAPGAGKGTQSREVSRKFGIPQISTGEMLRDAIHNKTELGRKVQPVIESGGLVPDGLVCELVEQRTAEADCKRGFILDGFPRNLEQALFLDRLLEARGCNTPVALDIQVGEDLLIKRLTGRRICPKCGTAYNIYFNPPQNDELCDKEGAALTYRSDDSEEAIRVRLQEYETQTKPLVDHYRSLGVLHEIDGSCPARDVTSEIFRLLRTS
ncbi:MAG TPA: adenylate kinase [Terriglobia bacterium]|nr:adenylate kinase [Terriglobia bacterium]